MSEHGRYARPITEIYFIAPQIYTCSPRTAYSIWLRRHLVMQNLIQVTSRSLRSTYNRDLLHSSSNTYTISEGRLFDLAEMPFSYVIFNTAMQYLMSYHGRSDRPITGTY
ncbi:hypothetical protein GIB67_025103, partial [Kingdonia uniflora]